MHHAHIHTNAGATSTLSSSSSLLTSSRALWIMHINLDSSSGNAMLKVKGLFEYTVEWVVLNVLNYMGMFPKNKKLTNKSLWVVKKNFNQSNPIVYLKEIYSRFDYVTFGGTKTFGYTYWRNSLSEKI